MLLGILRETKNPPDRRVPFTPLQCRQMLDRYTDLHIIIQPDKNRCFSNQEYQSQGISVQEDISRADLLMGLKEVKSEYLIPGKSYVFFSHTAKKQKHNLELLRSIVQKNIRLIDYEYFTDDKNGRIVAFGRWAGFVGAYNALRAYGLRYNKYNLKPAHDCKDRHELLSHLKEIVVSNQKIILTGGGRVAQGAMEILNAAKFEKITPQEFLSYRGSNVYAQLDPEFYVRHNSGAVFDLDHFFKNPGEYENSFLPYTHTADIFIACHFWDPRAPMLITPGEMRHPQFNLKIIADVSCDVNGPIASTLRASTIASPFYGYCPETSGEANPFDVANITVMSVDNLPGELPRDASEDFGKTLVSEVIPAFIGLRDTDIIERATISDSGRLTSRFAYLQDFLDGKE